MWQLTENNSVKQIEGLDRGLQFGDGFFETIRIENTQPKHFSYHLTRIEHSLTTLGFSISKNYIAELINIGLPKLLSESGLKQAVLKVLVTRGQSERGYGYGSNISSNVLLLLSEAKPVNEDIYSKGVEVGFCQTECSVNAQLAGLKHLNRLENVLARQEVSQGDVFEGLMSNHLGWIIEGTMSNAFFKIDGVWLTPKLNLSGVAGVARAWALDWFAKSGRPIIEADISQEAALTATNAFICNSQMGFIPVKRIEHSELVRPEFMDELQRSWKK